LKSLLSGKKIKIEDKEIVLSYGKEGKEEHRSRRIAYWDTENKRLFEFLTNNFKIAAEKVAMIYKKCWQIELLFKQLKQNFPLKYFLGDNQNAIEIQIWVSMLANLLLTLVKSKVKRKWAFSNMASFIRQ
jgi:IS4 transposase